MGNRVYLDLVLLHTALGGGGVIAGETKGQLKNVGDRWETSTQKWERKQEKRIRLETNKTNNRKKQ